MIIKPADKAPGAAVRLAEILREAGLPDGWLSVIVGDPEEMADVFADRCEVRVVSFTGSAAVGWQLAARAARKRVMLELGNVTPAVVAADADIELAAKKLTAGAFVNARQTCVSVQRIYVHHSVATALEHTMSERIAALRVGDPSDETTDVGPLITAEATDRAMRWIDEAVDGGARIVTGGGHADGIIQPTLLAEVAPTARLACEEAFAPVAVMWSFDDLSDAFASANNTDYGLQVGVFTRDVSTVVGALMALDFGGIIVNDTPSFRADEMPYGGSERPEIHARAPRSPFASSPKSASWSSTVDPHVVPRSRHNVRTMV